MRDSDLTPEFALADCRGSSRGEQLRCSPDDEISPTSSPAINGAFIEWHPLKVECVTYPALTPDLGGGSLAWIAGVDRWRGSLAWIAGVDRWRGSLAWIAGVDRWRGSLAWIAGVPFDEGAPGGTTVRGVPATGGLLSCQLTDKGVLLRRLAQPRSTDQSPGLAQSRSTDQSPGMDQHPARTGPPNVPSTTWRLDPAGLRGGCRADGPRHRPGPCGDRPARSSCTSRIWRVPRRVATGSRATWIGPSPRAASQWTIATRRSPGSHRRPTPVAPPTPTSSSRRSSRTSRSSRRSGATSTAIAPPAAIFASNTSSIAIHRLAEAVAQAASRAVRRDAFLQPGAGHAAHRADPRPRHVGRDRRGHPRARGAPSASRSSSRPIGPASSSTGS